MIDQRRRAVARAAAFLLGLACVACVFDKPKEEVQLTLDKVPAGTEQIQVVAVDKDDTAKVLGILVAKTPWVPGQTLHFPLGPAQGKEWLLRVEGYKNGILVYLALIPEAEYTTDTVSHPDVTPGWPAVLFASASHDSLKAVFTVGFRNLPDSSHWRLKLGTGYLASSTAEISIPVSLIKPGARLVADLHSSDSSALPVQVPDTILADEVLSPSGASLQIIDAFSANDSVFIKLDCRNFRLPSKDEAIPGQGNPVALDARGLRPLAGFGMVKNDSSRLAGPSSALNGVDNVVVALHYATGMRVRPPVADTVAAESALRSRVAAPAVKIIADSIVGSNLRLILQRENFSGLHCHITRDVLNTSDYEICRSDTCLVDSTVWKGAARVIVAAHRDEDHSLARPLVADTLIPPR